MTVTLEPTSRGAAEFPAGSAVAVEITYYTDPLCCWSWGFEPQWRRLRYAYAGRIAWRIRMGGMIGNWDSFADPVNAVHRPAQMGPLWLQAKYVTGMPIDPDIWVNDPPASSWPACLAVKAAELQSPQAGEAYLRQVREAALVEGRNIARPEVLAACADACAAAFPGLLDPDRFRADHEGAPARTALTEDVKEARFRGIGRFPALLVRRPGAGARALIGWRPYAALQAALLDLAPDLGPERAPPDADAYRAHWTRITDREVAEMRSAAG